MRKIFLDDLPIGGKYVQSDKINWKESIGKNVNFIYDNIKGKVKILDYDIQNQKVTFTYNQKEYSIPRNNFKSCKFGFMLGLITKEYKFKIGDIVNTTTGKIEILECIRMPHQNYTQKGYKYKCLIDGDIDNIRECHLVSGVGCKVCYGSKTLIGYNDIATTNPELLKYLVNKDDGFKYTCDSRKNVNVECPYCGFKKKMRISTLHRAGFGCNACSDGVSYPEKFFISLLNQLDIKFIAQLSKKTFKWCDKYRYDIFIKDINSIIELHGIQHYEVKNSSWGTLEEIQKNDYLKEMKAKENSINKYIILDCRYSELEWIKNSILNSELSKIFDLSNIEWLKCHEYSCNSFVKMSCDLWNEGFTPIEIGGKLRLHNSTILDYLKKGKLLGWCNYNVKQSRNKAQEKSTNTKLNKLPSIICLTTNEVFDNVHIASQKYNIARESINSNCKNKKYFKSAGKHPETGEPLRWMFYDDYIKRNNDEGVSLLA